MYTIQGSFRFGVTRKLVVKVLVCTKFMYKVYLKRLSLIKVFVKCFLDQFFRCSSYVGKNAGAGQEELLLMRLVGVITFLISNIMKAKCYLLF